MPEEYRVLIWAYIICKIDQDIWVSDHNRIVLIENVKIWDFYLLEKISKIRIVK